MSEQFVLTTVLKFDSGPIEGQCLHVGTRDECESLSNAMPAVAYSGDRRCIDARLVIAPQSELLLSSGERWRSE